MLFCDLRDPTAGLDQVRESHIVGAKRVLNARPTHERLTDRGRLEPGVGRLDRQVPEVASAPRQVLDHRRALGGAQDSMTATRVSHVSEQPEARYAFTPCVPVLTQIVEVFGDQSEDHRLAFRIASLLVRDAGKAIPFQRGGQMRLISIDEPVEPADTTEKLRVSTPFGKALYRSDLDERLGLLGREKARDDGLEPSPRRVRAAAALEVPGGLADLVARR